MKKLLGSIAVSLLFVLSFSVQAGPGSQINGIAVNNPADGMKIVEAFNTWMEGAGKKSKNRILLLQNVADGGNPATHSFVSIHPSMAANEAFNQSIGDDEAKLAEWFKFLEVVVPVSRITSTTRTAHIKAWGDVNNDDKVWLVHAMTATDGRSVYRALDAWMSSDTAKKFPGQMHLFAGVAGSQVSHTIALGYESEAEMEKWGDMSRGSADLAHLLSSLQSVTEYHGASLSREVAAWGADLEDVLKR